MLATLVAETTDGPVWALVAATFMLVVVTGVLAGAAIMALRELDEAKTDRHVQVVTSLAARWNGEMLVSALSAEQLYTEEELAEIVTKARGDPTANPLRELRRKRAIRELVVLLRIPDYFEDLAFMAQRVNLDDDALANFKGLVVDEWKAWEPAIGELGRTGDPYSYRRFEALVARMSDIPDV
jgi:hypothetical protein